MQITNRIHMIGIALLRVLVGVIFLWAGLEKLTAAKAFDASGFLKFAHQRHARLAVRLR